MRVSKWEVLAGAGFAAGSYALLNFLAHSDPSRVTSHLVGTAVVLALMPFMKRRLVPVFQIGTLAWLFGDIAFRNLFGHADPSPFDAGAWTPVLALAYAGIMIFVCFHLQAARARLQQVQGDPA